jgi:serine/threonine-protein kinase
MENGSGSLTQTHEMLGSPIYMSPEQMRSSRSVDARADIWSLGAMLYRFMTGHPPFEATTLPDLILRVTGAEPRRPTELRPDLSPELEQIILRCLDKNPSKRPASMAELAQLLAPFASPSSQQYAERAVRILRASAPDARRGSAPSLPPPTTSPTPRDPVTTDREARGATTMVEVTGRPARARSLAFGAVALSVVLLFSGGVTLSRYLGRAPRPAGVKEPAPAPATSVMSLGVIPPVQPATTPSHAAPPSPEPPAPVVSPSRPAPPIVSLRNGVTRPPARPVASTPRPPPASSNPFAIQLK